MQISTLLDSSVEDAISNKKFEKDAFSMIDSE